MEKRSESAPISSMDAEPPWPVVGNIYLKIGQLLFAHMLDIKNMEKWDGEKRGKGNVQNAPHHQQSKPFPYITWDAVVRNN